MAKVLMKGNEALAEAAIRAGVDGFFAYPITPQNEIGEYMSSHLTRAGGVFVQAESEIGAINMVYGAASTGRRAMTSSSSPGISLKQEGISTLCTAELPCVIVNMTRGGPGIGNIAPAQSDYFQSTKGGGHGDYHTIVLAPSTLQEMVDQVYLAFDLSEKWLNPVLLLGDGVMGQMMEPVDFRDRERPERRSEFAPWALRGTEGGRKPRLVKSLYLVGDTLYDYNMKQKEKWDRIIVEECRLEAVEVEDADYVIAAFGSVGRIARSALKLARAQGIKLGLVRPISLWPFPYEGVRAATAQAKGILTVEMNLGQMVEDIRLSVEGSVPVKFFGSPGGRVPTPEEIVAELRKSFI